MEEKPWEKKWGRLIQVGKARGLSRAIAIAASTDTAGRVKAFFNIYDEAKRNKVPIMVTMGHVHSFKRGAMVDGPQEDAEWVGFPTLDVVVYVANADGATGATGPPDECESLFEECESPIFDSLRISLRVSPGPLPEQPLQLTRRFLQPHLASSIRCVHEDVQNSPNFLGC